MPAIAEAVAAPRAALPRRSTRRPGTTDPRCGAEAMRSIERYLLLRLAGALCVGMLLVAAVGYFTTLEEMREVFDEELSDMATSVASFRHAGALAPMQLDRMDAAVPHDDSDIVTFIWSRAGQRLFASDPRVRLAYADVTGLSHQQVGHELWAIYTLVLPDNVVQAAQRESARRAIARESAAKVLPPMLLLTVLASVWMVFSLRRGLRSLDGAAREVAARSAQSLEPIATGTLPREIEPLVSSVNGLMQRLSRALTAQRRFLADAAHELRSPATALRLQLQMLERADDEALRAASMHALRAGVERSQHLIEQLLQVARTGVDGEPLRRQAVDLCALVRSVVGNLAIKAEHRGIDLGARAEGQLFIDGDINQLTVLLNNLVENALHYVHAGGTVDVGAEGHGGVASLFVVDDGPGIDEAERERVFDRFYRGTTATRHRSRGGSGLGLAIVKAVATRHGAQVSLRTPPGGQGLEVRVDFPAAPPLNAA